MAKIQHAMKKLLLAITLNAISAARSNENGAVISNLTNAISLNANYKAEANIDLEFVNLRTNEAFIALTKQ